ncbi:MAG: IS110 family transposase [Gammaproteobacteria bacterium]|nr:IS110 family transposase [Gammaproteobacteria bacterium]
MEKLNECIVGLENPRSGLVDFLAGRGCTIVLTNPNAISSYRQSRKPSKAKSDAADAQLIADYAREHHKSLQRIQIPDETTRELSLLLEDRDRLIQQKVRYSNQLTSTLKEYFPQALDAFGSIDSKCAIKFLKRVDSFAQVKALSKKKREQLLKECGVHRKDSKERFREAMNKREYHISQAVIKAKTRLKKVIIIHLDLLTQQVQEYETQIQSLMDDSPHGRIFQSLPGAAYILGAKLLVLYSTRDFTDASEAQQLFGTAPYTAMSGQARPCLGKPDLWASEKALINLVGTLSSNLPGVPPGQAPGLRNSTKKDATREKVHSMLTDVLLIPGSRSPLPCGNPKLHMMKENTWLLLLIILSINLLL